MPIRRALFASIVVLAGCGEAALPVAATPPRPAPKASVAVVAVKAVAPPVAPPEPEAAPAPALAVPAPPAMPLPALPRTFATFTVPGAKESILGIAGRSLTDLWFVTNASTRYGMSTGGVLHFDGKRVDRAFEPRCQGMFLSILITDKEILLAGEDPGSGSWTSAHHPFKGGGWSCDLAWWGVAMGRPNGYFSPTGHAAGAATWALDCASPFWGPCLFRGAGGRRAPFVTDVTPPPEHENPDNPGPNPKSRYFQLRGEEDGWMVVDDGRQGPELLRYNGVSWRVISKLDDLDVSGMWIDPEGNPWITATGALVHHDGKTTARLPVTEEFAPTVIAGTGARDVWFFGPGRAAYQWDGERLHQGEAPFEVGAAWAAPNGEIWVAGRWDPDKDDATTPAGVVARTPALRGAP